MRNYMYAFLFFFVWYQGQAQHAIFNELLQKHVSKTGLVDYLGFKNDEAKLNTYLAYLEKTVPANSWSANKQKAFWINAYNAYTLQLILKEYPLKSIVDIQENDKTAWNIAFAKVGGETYTLDAIEHVILRKKFADPRIHVGVNCASASCPKLGNIAFTEKNIEANLEELMNDFINDSSRNKLSRDEIQISPIFDWFQEDFTQNGSVITYINKYSKTNIKANAKISYLEYDWSLNSKL